jgi:hypothetical protein
MDQEKATAAAILREQVARGDLESMCRTKSTPALAPQYPRHGCRMIRILGEREGHDIGAARTYRLWRQEGLQVPKKRPRRRVATAHAGHLHQ